MSDGELAFLVLVGACFAVFATVVIWLRTDYVRHRGQPLLTNARLEAQMAE
jgi:hypothetical protein